jgi:hypothetical protein
MANRVGWRVEPMKTRRLNFARRFYGHCENEKIFGTRANFANL